ncbi:hypothetical protein D3C75_869840 [compost metagenome]
MSGKGNCHITSGNPAQGLLNFGNMLVLVQLIRRQVLVNLRIMDRQTQTPSRSRHTGLGINNNGGRIDPARLYRRDQTQQGSSGVTARIGDKGFPRHLRSKHLRQTIHSFIQIDLCGRLLLIPFAVCIRALQPEIA